MSTVPPLRREHARRGAGQAQREIHRHRVLADAAANAVRAEILTCHRIFSLRAPPRPRVTASTVAATSWARTIRAPFRTAMAASATLPAGRSSTARARELRRASTCATAPRQSARPAPRRSPQLFEQHQVVVDASCRSQIPDRPRVATLSMPAARQAAMRAARNALHLGHHVVVVRRLPASCAARPACA